MADSVTLNGIIEADETFFSLSYKGNHKNGMFKTPRNGLELIQLKGSKTIKGIYNIQHINNYHSQLKQFLSPFNGVSTKHLDNYLIWHNFVNYAPESEVDKRTILLNFVMSQALTIHVEDISKKPALPFVA